MKKLRYFFEILLVRGLGWAVERMPRHGMLAFARFVGTIGYYLDTEGRTTALENLRVAFPGEMDDACRRQVALDCYRNFARNFAELFWSPRLTEENWRSLISIEDTDAGAIEEAKSKGAIWLTAHFGCFELTSITMGFRGVPMTTVAQDFKNEGLTPLFQRLRSHPNHTLIPQQSAIVRLMKVLGRGGHVAMLADLNIRPGRASTIIQCFGLMNSVPKVHAMLAGRFESWIVPGVCLPREDGGYHLKTLAPISLSSGDQEHLATQQCWDRFEAEIRLRPELWMWMYKHWRYLPTDLPDPNYPDYANRNRRFQRMLLAQKTNPPAHQSI